MPALRVAPKPQNTTTKTAKVNSKPIALPRPPQTRAAYFKRPYPKCPGSEILATDQRCLAGSLQIRF